MSTQQMLDVLRGAVRELSSQPGTPTAAAAAASQPPDAAAAAPSTAHLLLQISALHKAFLSLSEAFMEELNGRQAEQEEQRQSVQSVRRECAGKLQIAAALHADVQRLAAAEGHQARSQAVLAQRCGQMEREVAGLRQQLEDREADLEQQVERAVARQLGAAEQRWQQQLMPAAAERGVQRWVADALPQLLQPMQDAVAATAELAAGIAADVVEVAREVEQLAAAHRNHEQRLCRYEEGAMQASDAAADASASAAAVEQLRQQVRSLQMGHAQLDEGLQQLRQEQAAEAAHGDWQYRQQSEAAMPQLPAVQQRLAAVVDQQAAQAKTTEHLVSSVTTDVMALARHTKALDREMRHLRKEVQQAQQALLQSCSVFSRALAIPSPVGPFTSLPPQL